MRDFFFIFFVLFLTVEKNEIEGREQSENITYAHIEIAQGTESHQDAQKRDVGTLSFDEMGPFPETWQKGKRRLHFFFLAKERVSRPFGFLSCVFDDFLPHTVRMASAALKAVTI